MMSSIVAQDFLLATSVLVLDLDEDLISPLPVPTETRMVGVGHLDSAPPNREEIVESLRSAHRLWLKASKTSQEARKVATAVKLVLSRLGDQDEYTDSPSNCKCLFDATLVYDELTFSSCGCCNGRP
jgi:hypothetical protein